MSNEKLIIRLSGTTVLALCVNYAFSQSDTVSQQISTSSSSNLLHDLIGVVILLAITAIISHMVYTICQTFCHKKTYSVEDFKKIRHKKGLPEQATSDETAQQVEWLNEAFFTWSNVEINEDNDQFRRPRKMKEIKKSTILLNNVKKSLPTDEQNVATYNEYMQVIYSHERRSFNGSFPLIIVGLIFAIIVGLMSMSSTTSFLLATIKFGAFFWIPVTIYYISSLTPQLLIEKRNARNGGNISTGLVAVALGILGSGFTIRTKYTDGSYEDDHSGHYIAWILGIIALTIVALTISFWSIFNYLRNYVLYF